MLPSQIDAFKEKLILPYCHNFGGGGGTGWGGGGGRGGGNQGGCWALVCGGNHPHPTD